LGLSVQAQSQIIVYGLFERLAMLAGFLVEFGFDVVVQG
jgi:hypothetical protein